MKPRSSFRPRFKSRLGSAVSYDLEGDDLEGSQTPTRLNSPLRRSKEGGDYQLAFPILRVLTSLLPRMRDAGNDHAHQF